MPTEYVDQFYTFDPANPPAVGAPVSFVTLTLRDQNDDGDIDRFDNDTVDGIDVTRSYAGDTVTIDVPGTGPVTYTGVTFYLADGGRVFTPNDGQVLQNGTFVNSTFVTSEGALVVPGDLGPPCFTPGTLILTPEGERPVETLAVGDRVTTRDRGAQEILWTGARSVAGIGPFAPILIRAGVFGNRRDLLVSPQHRMLVRGWRAELHAGLPEVMVAAAHLVNGSSVVRAPCPEVRYIHFLCARHEIVHAEGALTESLDPAGDLAAGDREIARLFPGLLHGGGRAAPVRPAVRGYVGRAMAL